MGKPKGKKAKGSLPSKGQLNPIQSRKQKRKEGRKQKKKLKHDFYSKRRLNSKEENSEKEEIESKEEDLKKMEEERKKKEKEEKKRRQEKEKMKQRRKQLKRENEIEDKNIKRLEKQLKLNKRKGSGLPASFKEDGLDFLMEFCDADKTDLEQLIRNDEEDEDDKESNSDQDESEEEEEAKEEEVMEEEEMEEKEEEEVMEDEEMEEKEEESEEETEEELEEELEEPEEELEEETEEKEWEDIYGRKRDSKGNIIKKEGQVKGEGSTKYVPPALRAKLSEGDREKRLRLERQVKGQLNRLAESNLHLISRQIEDYYSTNSRNDMNEVLCSLMTDSLISPTITPERLIMEHAVLVAVLHANVGTEVGASIIQTMVTQFNDKYAMYEPVPDDQISPKELDNHVQLISQLYAFKVIGSELIFGLLNKLAGNFEDKDVELILIMLKSVGFLLRKDDPSKLKDLILDIQSQSSKKASENNGEADLRVKFMLETLLAIKNNNVKKIPNYDPTQQQHLQKIVKSFLRGDCQVTPLKIGYDDLLSASTKGRWWIVGSAWTGKEQEEPEKKILSGPKFSMELLDLARKMRMNTDARKSIFCSIMSSEDYIEATERVVKLTIKTQKEREVLFVILTCCLKEKTKFNPFYSQLVEKLSAVDRKYRLSAQYAIWDKVKEIKSLKQHQIHNLALFTSKLIQTQVLSLSSLKVVEFSDLEKVSVGFLKAVLGQLLEMKDERLKCEIFSLVAQQPKLTTFKEGLKLFMRHFMLKSNKEPEFKTKIEQAELWLMSKDKQFVL